MKCPCGAEHQDSDRSIRTGISLARLVAEAGETVPVTTPDGTWDVPRVYIGYHGLKAWELPELAARYGWPKATQ